MNRDIGSSVSHSSEWRKLFFALKSGLIHEVVFYTSIWSIVVNVLLAQQLIWYFKNRLWCSLYDETSNCKGWAVMNRHMQCVAYPMAYWLWTCDLNKMYNTCTFWGQRLLYSIKHAIVLNYFANYFQVNIFSLFCCFHWYTEGSLMFNLIQ